MIEEFEKEEAIGSTTYPMQAGNVHKGDFAILKGHPCKIVEVRIFKTGKHGHAKANFTGMDIFTNKKYEDVHPTSHAMDVPFVSRQEYNVCNIEEDGYLEVLRDNGQMKDDLQLPIEEDFKELTARIQGLFLKEVDINVHVIHAMGMEMIIDVKEA